eukprot:1108937-Heterocapsa_arctica.AAC.1
MKIAKALAKSMNSMIYDIHFPLLSLAQAKSCTSRPTTSTSPSSTYTYFGCNYRWSRNDVSNPVHDETEQSFKAETWSPRPLR